MNEFRTLRSKLYFSEVVTTYTRKRLEVREVVIWAERGCLKKKRL